MLFLEELSQLVIMKNELQEFKTIFYFSLV